MIMQIFEEGLEKLFILVLNMTLTGIVVILAVLAARFLLKKAPKVISYALWAVVLFRLLSPVSFSLPVSLLGALQNEPAKEGRMEYITEDIGFMEKPEINLPAPGISEAVNERLPLGNPEVSVNPIQIYITIGAYLWLLGITSMGIYSVISWWRLRKRLKDAVHEKENIYRIRGKSSPFVCGLFRPRIYLPEKITGEEERYILLHEQIHIKRGDAFFRLLAYLALWLHWFNPFVWVAFALSGRDMEMSCDEAVIQKLGSKVKKEYSASLLNAASGERIVKGIPLAFGESDTGSRIKNVLRYKKPAALLAGGAVIVSIILAVVFLANPAKAKANENIFYGIAVEVMGEEGAQQTVVRIPRFGDVVLPDAKDVSLYLERDAERIIMPGDLLRITFSEDKEVFLISSDQYGRTLYRFAPVPDGEAESIQVMGEGFLLERQEEDRYLFTVPLGMAAEAKEGDTLEIYHYPKADTTEEIYLSMQAAEPGQVLLASTKILSVDAEQYDIWVELSAEETEVFLSEFGFGISAKLIKEAMPADYGGNGTDAAILSDDMSGEQESNVPADYATILSEDMLSIDARGGGLALSRELLENGEFPDGMYVVYVRSVSRSSRGFDLYVTDDEVEGDFPLLAFADDCVFRVNWEKDKISYSPVNFDKFADLITQSAKVINPTVYCEMEDNLIVRADLESGYYMYGFSYERPAKDMWNLYAEGAGGGVYITEEDILRKYYTLSGTETADIGDGAGMEQIEVYTGNIGDGESGVVIFKDAGGNTIGTEFAHAARAGWNNVYIGDAEDINYVLTVSIEDRDSYGSYGYQVYRLGEAGEIRQIAGSRFEFGEYDDLRYDDEMFHDWADNLSYYLENSHLVLSSQEGEIRTETISEADKYNYETLKREP